MQLRSCRSGSRHNSSSQRSSSVPATAWRAQWRRQRGARLAQRAAEEADSIVFAQQLGDATERPAFPLHVPLLPFPVEEVLLPGSAKTLHLYEARYLALLDAVLAGGGSNKWFAHVVVEQAGDEFVGDKAASFPGAFCVASEGAGSVVLLMATLARVVQVKRSQLGALVRIQAEGRVAVTGVTQRQPYMTGDVQPLADAPLAAGQEQQVQEQMEQLLQTMRDLQNLTQRYRTRQSAALLQAMAWWERPLLLQCSSAAACDAAAQAASSSSSQPGAALGEQPDTSSLAERAARLSFAALQGTPEEGPKDQLQLLRCSVNAMSTRDTLERLAAVAAHMRNSTALLAAKCALKSLRLG